MKFQCLKSASRYVYVGSTQGWSKHRAESMLQQFFELHMLSSCVPPLHPQIVQKYAEQVSFFELHMRSSCVPPPHRHRLIIYHHL